MVDTKKAAPAEGSPSNSKLQHYDNTGTNDAAKMREAALALADSFGWRIVPLHGINPDGSCDCGDSACKSPGKHPRTDHGVKQATTDADQIAAWWGQWSNANIGVATGKESGIFVVDYDKNKSGDDRLCGMEAFDQDSAKFAEVRDTLQIQSGSGGRHAIFQYPKEVQIGCRNKINHSHVDVRGDGGYIIAPPSLHQSGNLYQWAQSGAILEASEEALKSWDLTGREQDDAGNDWERGFDETVDTRELQKINEALSHIRPLGDDWLKGGMALHDRFNGSPEGFQIWRAWSRTAPGYENEPAADHWKRWVSFGNYKGASITLATVYKAATGAGWVWAPPDDDDLIIVDVPSKPPTTHDGALPAQRQSCVQLLGADQVKVRPIRWLWSGWLASGKLHILAGSPGTGKTTLAMALASAVTTGGSWPDGTRAPLGDVLIWSGEDDPADTLVPRLLAAGCNLERVKFIHGVNERGRQRSFDPAKDLLSLRDAFGANFRPSLMIVDPIVSAVAGDSHKNTEVRRALQPMVDLGLTYDCAVLGISHFSKGSGNVDPLNRVTGSVAFGALARIVMCAAKLNGDKGGGRAFLRTKSNIGRDDGGYRYELEYVDLESVPGVETSRIAWGTQLEGEAKELLEEEQPDMDKSATDEAEELLRELLANGPITAKVITKEARDASLSDKAIRRAKSRLGLIRRRIGFGKDGYTEWDWSETDRIS